MSRSSNPGLLRTWVQRPTATPAEQDYAQEIVNESFNEFINDVTTQRMIARSDIDDGRVIRGADAIKINLVDKLGNLNDAIEGAKELAAARK